MTAIRAEARERGGGGLREQQEVRHHEHSTACEHGNPVLVRLDCGAGGDQFRHYCVECWAAIGGAIPHEQARAEQARTGVIAPLADIEQLRAARDCYLARGEA